MLVLVAYGVARAGLQAGVDYAAKISPGQTEHEQRKSREAWGADHPWGAAIADAAALPLAIEVLVLVRSGPSGLRVALALLVAVIAPLAVAVLRLERSRQEKEAYQRAYEGAT